MTFPDMPLDKQKWVLHRLCVIAVALDNEARRCAALKATAEQGGLFHLARIFEAKVTILTEEAAKAAQTCGHPDGLHRSLERVG